MNRTKNSTRVVQDEIAPILASSSRTLPLGGVGKRIFDIVFSLIALANFLIVLVVISLCIRMITRGPAFYVHRRVGFGGATFPCLKFRTMMPDADEQLERLLSSDPAAREEFEKTHKLRNDPRIIPGIGSFLRKTSLDELPQFLNVLAGHMSIVGPRPVTAQEVQMYGPVAAKYLRTRPGITGLWQVSGRSDTSFEKRARLDSSYVDNWSFGLDLRIVMKTAFVLTDGAY